MQSIAQVIETLLNNKSKTAIVDVSSVYGLWYSYAEFDELVNNEAGTRHVVNALLVKNGEVVAPITEMVITGNSDANSNCDEVGFTHNGTYYVAGLAQRLSDSNVFIANESSEGEQWDALTEVELAGKLNIVIGCLYRTLDM